MIRIFLLFGIFLSFINAHSIDIDENFDKFLYENETYYYSSNNKTETIHEIKKKEFIKTQKNNFPKSKKIIWVKFHINNYLQHDIELFFRNIRAGTDYINVYILDRDTVQKEFLLGDLRSQDQRELISKKSAFSYLFKAHGVYDIYVRYESLGAISNQWEIFTQKEFISSEMIESTIWGLISGIILSIIVYNFVIFILTKNSAFLFYILSSISSLIFLLAVNGVLYQLNIGLNLYLITMCTWIFGYTYILCMFIFIVKFFNEKESTLIYRVIQLFVILLLLIILLLIFAFFKTEYLYIISKIDMIIVVLSFFILFIAIYKFRLREKDTFYFLLGQFVYLSSFTYYIIQVSGLIPLNYYSWLSLPLGFVFELICISIALNSRLKVIEIKKDKFEQLLLEQARFTNTAKTISYIVHQLKKPISLLGSQINLIEATLIYDEKELKKVLHEILPKSRNTFEYINEVSSSVSTMYLNPKGIEVFNLKEQIEILLFIQSDFINNYKIELSKSFENFDITTYKGTLSNVLMVILENSIYALSKKNYVRKILITCKKSKNNTIIIIEDNAGGIDNIEQIFDIEYSTKGKDGSGIGLSLAYMLVYKKLKGTIEVFNTKEGAKFYLKIPSLE